MYFLWIFLFIFCCNCFILSSWIHILGLHCVFCLWKLLWVFKLKTLVFGWMNLLDCGCNFDQGCVQLLDKWKDSVEALLSPNDTLCLHLGHARGTKIRKEEENTTLIPGVFLEKNFRGFLLRLSCTVQPVVFWFWFFSYEETKLLFNNGEGSICQLL